MAQAFRPSRSAIYGSPVRDALLDVGNAVTGRLVNWDAENRQEEMQADYIEQMTTGGIAFRRGRAALLKDLRENYADKPDLWPQRLKEGTEGLRKASLEGVRNPRARQGLGLKLDEDLAQLELDVADLASKQRATNLGTNFAVGIEEYSRTEEYADWTDVQGKLQDAFAFVDTHHNAGGPPSHAKVGTPEAAMQLKKELARKVLGDYAVQQALVAGDPAQVAQVNEMAAGLFEGDEPLFGPDELGQRTKQAKDAIDGAKAEAEDARKARAAAFETEATNALLAGKFTFTDDKGNTINWRDAIVNNPDLDPEKKRTLEGEYEAQTKARGSGKTYSETDKLQAYIEIRTETDRTQKLALLKKHAAGLGFNEVQALYDKMADPAKDDSHLATGLSTTITALKNARTRDVTDEKEVATAHIDLLRVQDRILRQWDEHPDWTTQQRLDAMQAELAPVKDEAAKEQVKKLDRALKMMSAGNFLYASPLAQGMYAAKQQQEQQQAPAGLENYWSKLTPERKEKVRKLLAQGTSLNRIIEALEK